MHAENYTLEKTNSTHLFGNTSFANSSFFIDNPIHMAILINVLVSQQCVQYYTLQASAQVVKQLSMWYLEEFFTRNLTTQQAFNRSGPSVVARQESNCTVPAGDSWKLIAFPVMAIGGCLLLMLLCCCVPLPCVRRSVAWCTVHSAIALKDQLWKGTEVVATVDNLLGLCHLCFTGKQHIRISSSWKREQG